MPNHKQDGQTGKGRCLDFDALGRERRTIPEVRFRNTSASFRVHRNG